MRTHWLQTRDVRLTISPIVVRGMWLRRSLALITWSLNSKSLLFEKELRSYKPRGKLYCACQTVPVALLTYILRASKAVATKDLFTFYKTALQQAARDDLKASKEKPGLYEDIAIDEEDKDAVRLDNENENLERCKDPRYFKKV